MPPSCKLSGIDFRERLAAVKVCGRGGLVWVCIKMQPIRNFCSLRVLDSYGEDDATWF